MIAISIAKPGGPEVLKPVEVVQVVENALDDMKVVNVKVMAVKKF